MTNEAKKVELTNSTGFPRSYTCAAGTAITKGTLMALTDARTAIAASSRGQPSAGVASEDKSATDPTTRVTCWTDGVFEMTASGNILAGEPVQMSTSGTNKVELATATASGAAIIGYALETASDAERINVRLRL